jgi:hypothetical protein
VPVSMPKRKSGDFRVRSITLSATESPHNMIAPSADAKQRKADGIRTYETDVTVNNVGSLRVLNKVIFPVSYNEGFYKDVQNEENKGDGTKTLNPPRLSWASVPNNTLPSHLSLLPAHLSYSFFSRSVQASHGCSTSLTC